jgi:hypothetical protein
MGINEELEAISRRLSHLISAPEASEPNHEPVKIIVAVHGIGDQFAFETVRSVADRFCQYMGLPSAIPLGRFHSVHGTVTGAYIPRGNMKWFPVGLGFAEIYWADIPRELVKEGHTLDESKRWARTIVERIQLRETGLRRLTKRQVQDNRLMVQVIEEMIQGVAVLDRLMLVTKKAGLFSFDLNKLLNDFLNDVQVVAEFSAERQRMLDIFDKVMKAIEAKFPKAEIYVIAHSEGTVVSFLGLLSGLAGRSALAPQTTPGVDPEAPLLSGLVGRPAPAPGTTPDAALDGPLPSEPADRPTPASWTSKIKGYMTIGSPLNKHVLFWRELFDVYKPPATGAGRPIPWRNYYDHGDPIGFDLRTTRNWMKKTEWGRFFEFNGPEDIEAVRRVREARQKIEEVRRRAQAIQAIAPAATAAARAVKMADLAERIAERAPRVPDPEEKAAKALRRAGKAEAKVREAERAAPKAQVKPAKAKLPPPAQADRAEETLPPLHDVGFTRYYFPGAAHNDYWRDEQVFGHFIQDVVDPDHDKPNPKLKQPAPPVTYKTPPTRVVAQLTSYVLPYLFSAALLLLGVYPLYKTVRACIAPTEAEYETALEIARNVLGLGSLIGGMTILARIPRLSRSPTWQAIAVLIFVASAVLFHWLVDQKIRVKIGSFLLVDWVALAIVLVVLAVVLALLALAVRPDLSGTSLWPIGRSGVFAALVLVSLWGISWINSGRIDPATHHVSPATGPIDPATHRVYPATATGVLVTLACAIGLLAAGLSRSYPSLGMKPLIHTGGLLILVIVGSSILSRQSYSQVAQYLEEKRVERARNDVIQLFGAAQREIDQAQRLAEQAHQEVDERAKRVELEEAQAAVRRAEEARQQAIADVPRVAELAGQAQAFRVDGPIWPVVLAGLIFLYLWWLAALLFDLTFVWHRYIRHAVGLSRLKKMIEGKV